MNLINQQDPETSNSDESNKDGSTASTSSIEGDSDEVDDNADFFDVNENFADNKNQALQRIYLAASYKNIIIKKRPSIPRLVDAAINELNERGGSSKQAILKFIIGKNLRLTESRLKPNIKRYIRNCLADGTMMRIKNSFKLTSKHADKIKQKQQQQLQVKKAKQTADKTNKKPDSKTENTSKKTKYEVKRTKIVRKENPEKEPTKIIKLKKNETKNMEKPKLKTQEPPKLISAANSHESKQPDKNKTLKQSLKSEGAAVAIAAAEVKASGRSKRR